MGVGTLIKEYRTFLRRGCFHKDGPTCGKDELITGGGGLITGIKFVFTRRRTCNRGG